MPDLSGLVGVRFLDGGRVLEQGLDCWGLLMEAQRRFGRAVPNFQIPCHATQEIGGIVASELGRWKKVEVPEPGDVVMMANDIDHPEIIQHFGTYFGGYKSLFLHTLEKTGAIMTSIHHEYWARKIRGYVRWTG